VDRVNGEAYPGHTGLPRDHSGAWPDDECTLQGSKCKGQLYAGSKSYREKVEVEDDRELQRTSRLTCILGRDAN
jgi:hypothetical protein